MTDTNWAKLMTWEETMGRDSDGRIPIRFGLTAILYFHEGHTEKKRRASLTCFNEYDQMYGELLR